MKLIIKNIFEQLSLYSNLTTTDFCNNVFQCGLPQNSLMLWDVELPSVPKPPNRTFEIPDVTLISFLLNEPNNFINLI